MSLKSQIGHLLFSRYLTVGALAISLLAAVVIAFAPLSLILGSLGLAMLVLVGWLLLSRPVYAIPIVLLIAPLAAYESRAGWPIIGFLPISSGQIALMGLFILWLVSWLLRKDKSLPQAKSFTWLLAFAAIMIVTILAADSVADGAKEVVKWVQMGMMMLICLDLAQQESKNWKNRNGGAWLLFGFVAAAGLSQAIIGIAQFTAADGPESFQILGRFYRAFGTFEQPNPYGGYMAWQTVLLLGVCLRLCWGEIARFLGLNPDHRNSSSNLWFLTGILLVGAIMGVALIASWSRGAWLAAFVGVGTILFFLPQDRRYGIGLIVAGMIGLGLVLQFDLLPASISDRVTSSADIEFAALRDQEVSPANFAILERQAFWQAAFSMFESDIWLGVGFGNYDAAYPDHFVGRWEKSLGHAHNYYINLLAETGLIGLFSYLLFWGVLIWQIIRKLPKLSFADSGLALGILGVWFALATHHLVDKMVVNNNWLILGAILAIQEILLRQNNMISRKI